MAFRDSTGSRFVFRHANISARTHSYSRFGMNCSNRLREQRTAGLERWGRLASSYNLVMKNTRQLTAIIEREDDSYVALCPELDIASQGGTVEEARKNLVEALELFFASADPTEVSRRLHSEVFVTRVEVAIG